MPEVQDFSTGTMIFQQDDVLPLFHTEIYDYIHKVSSGPFHDLCVSKTWRKVKYVDPLSTVLVCCSSKTHR